MKIFSKIIIYSVHTLFDLDLLCEEWCYFYWQKLHGAQVKRSNRMPDCLLSCHCCLSLTWLLTAKIEIVLSFLSTWCSSDTACERQRCCDRLGDHGKGPRRIQKRRRSGPLDYCKEKWENSAQVYSSPLWYKARSKNLSKWLLHYVGEKHFQSMRRLRFLIC